MLNFTMRGTLKKPSNNLNKIQNMYRKNLVSISKNQTGISSPNSVF